MSRKKDWKMQIHIGAKEKPNNFIKELQKREIGFTFKKLEKLEIPVITVRVREDTISVGQLLPSREEKILNNLVNLKKRREKQQKT